MSMWVGSNYLMNSVSGFLPRKICFSPRPSHARFMMDKVALGLWSTSRFRTSIIPSVFPNHSLLNSNNVHLLYYFTLDFLRHISALFELSSGDCNSRNQAMHYICVYILSLQAPAHVNFHVQDIVLLDTDLECSSDPMIIHSSITEAII